MNSARWFGRYICGGDTNSQFRQPAVWSNLSRPIFFIMRREETTNLLRRAIGKGPRFRHTRAIAVARPVTISLDTMNAEVQMHSHVCRNTAAIAASISSRITNSADGLTGAYTGANVNQPLIEMSVSCRDCARTGSIGGRRLAVQQDHNVSVARFKT